MDITMDIPTKHKRPFELVNEAVKRLKEQLPDLPKKQQYLLILKKLVHTKGNLHLDYGVSVVDRVREV